MLGTNEISGIPPNNVTDMLSASYAISRIYSAYRLTAQRFACIARALRASIKNPRLLFRNSYRF